MTVLQELREAEPCAETARFVRAKRIFLQNKCLFDIACFRSGKGVPENAAQVLASDAIDLKANGRLFNLPPVHYKHYDQANCSKTEVNLEGLQRHVNEDFEALKNNDLKHGAEKRKQNLRHALLQNTQLDLDILASTEGLVSAIVTGMNFLVTLIIRFKAYRESQRVETFSQYFECIFQNIQLKIAVLEHEAITAAYNPDALRCLRRIRLEINESQKRLHDHLFELEIQLKVYSRASADFMDIAELYRTISHNIELVQKDLQLLAGQ